MDKRPTMDEMWTLLQEQRAEIDRLKDEVTAHKQQVASASWQAGVAVLPSRAAVGAGPGTEERPTAEVAGHEGAAETTNGHHPDRAQPAATRKGWRGRRGPKPPAASGQQKLLPKPDDTTPVAIGRRLSRMGLLKAAAAGVVGVAAAEVAGSTDAPQAHAYDEQDYFTANGGYGANSIAFQTAHHDGYSGYDWGVLVSGNKCAVEGVATLGCGVRGSSAGELGPGVEGISNRSSHIAPIGEQPPGVRGISQLDFGPGGGVGVEGVSGSGVGVYGTVTSGTGVKGTSASGTGLWGESGGVGIRGISSGSQLTGIYGVHTANNGVGVAGRSYANGSQSTLGAGIGVWGDSGTGIGVKGTTSLTTRTQLGSSGGTGVLGESVAGYGVRGRSHGLPGVGVSGLDTANTGIGVLGQSYATETNTGGAGIGVLGSSGTGIGVRGEAGSGTAVEGDSASGTGVVGSGNTGVRGISSGTNRYGIQGIHIANNGIGVFGRSYADSSQSAYGAGTGVYGDSGSGTGVQGVAVTGRGGVFSGGAAQLQLVPSSLAHPPTSGQKGDIFLDSLARLWLCTAGGANAVWVTMGAGGGGGSNGGPIVAHSAVIATPGVYGDNTTNDPSSIGISGASVDGNGNPGAGTGVKGTSGTGKGVLGTTTSGDAVHGTSQSGTGVVGEGGVGVRGISSGSQLTGVYGINTTSDGTGVAGRSYKDSTQTTLGGGFGVWGDTGSGIGVQGTADSGTGVQGTSTSGRGGVFSGGAAQLQLVPAAGSHHDSGQAGDLFVDGSNNLWFCQGGANWVQLGAAGGGGNGGPLTGHSTVIASPGVYGYNDTADAKSIGVSGANVDTSGNPGHGIGVQGSSGDGDGVKGWTLTGYGVFGISYADQTQAQRGYGVGVRGETAWGFGVSGYSQNGTGVDAGSDGDNAPALHARNSGNGTGAQCLSVGGLGVEGISETGIAVSGHSTSGRGGFFFGGLAQVRLAPGGPTHPDTGLQGDLYLDSSSRLWLCTADNDATAWRQVQVA